MSIEKRLTVSSSPHIKIEDDTRSIMLDVLIALFFPLVLAVYFFSWRALILTVVSVVCCIGFEILYQKLMKKPVTASDLSAAVTGVLLAFNLPVTAPYWLPVIGSFFAIVIVKQLYGGIGKNFMNPALAARAFLFSWPVIMTTWVKPLASAAAPLFGSTADVATGATPLSFLKFLKPGPLPDASLFDAFLGKVGGCLGETSALMLLLGGIYLVVRKVITPRIPLCYLGTVALLTFIFPRGDAARLDWMLYQLLSGGLMLGAIFMATDYSTSPVTKRGQVIFGIGCGVLTVFMRYFGSLPEGVSYAILIMNVCTWMIDKNSRPSRFGVRRFGKAGA